MNGSFFQGLIYNASLLLAMVLVFDLTTSNLYKRTSIVWRILAGVFLGGVGLAVMSTNWELLPGVVFDTRSVLLGITGLFFGWIPTFIAMLLTSVYRIYQGGVGVMMGVPVIITSCLIGLTWRVFRIKNLDKLSWIELLIFGLLIHVGMLLCTRLLPIGIRDVILSQIWLPVMTIYPVATVLLGLLISSRLRKDEMSDELKESEEKFSKAFNTSPFIIIMTRAEDGKIVEVNGAFEKLSGYTRKEAMEGTSIGLNLWADIHDREIVLKEIMKGKVITNREYKFRKKDGEVLVGSFSSQIIKVRGKPYILAIIEDISKRIEDEKRLEIINSEISTEKRKLEAILRDMGDAVFVTDDKKKIIMVNKAMEVLFGLSEKEMAGRDIEEVLALSYETTGEKPRDLIEKVFEKKKLAKPENTLVIKNKNGMSISVDGVASPIINENGSLTGTVWVLRDVSKEKELQKMRTDFISLASHQLRTPLTGIKWFVELLDQNATKMPLEKVLEYIKKIESSNNRMIDLVNDLMTTSRAESGKLQKDISNYPVKDLLQQAIDEQGKIFLDKNIRIDGISKVSDDIKLDADMVQMIQVFGNLFNNAASYSPSGSTIEVNVEQIGESVKIVVKDHGVGIPREQQKRVFGKFFRADNIAKTIPGSGLGLYVAKSMVENHGGRIWFESKENIGTTFFVELPIKQNKDGKKEKGDDRGG